MKTSDKTNEIFSIIKKLKIVPAVKIEDASDASIIADSLSKGGLPIIEVTYRNDNAGISIKKIRTECPDILCGAGTVTDLSKAKDAVKNGAQFIVMPGYDEKTVDWCLRKNIPVIPGVATPTEITACINKGLKLLKLFPASILGGSSYLKAISGPFSEVQFIPTGGVNSENAKEYLSLSNVAAIGGSWLTPAKVLKEKSFGLITTEAEKLLSAIID